MKKWRLTLTTVRELTDEEYAQYKREMPLPVSWSHLERLGHDEVRSRVRPDEEVVTRIRLQPLT